MKQKALRLIFCVACFSFSYFLATLTGLELVQNAVLLAFLIHWLLFIPAYLLKTEKFFDLSGSVTYISIVSYVLFFNYNSENIIGNLILASFIIIWAVRLGSFLFFRIKKAGEDKRFRELKISFTRFFLVWNISAMWVSFCSMCAITAISSGNGVQLNPLFYIGAVTFLVGFVLEIVADHQKTAFRKDPKNKDKFIKKSYDSEINLDSGGKFNIKIYESLYDGTEQIVLTKGDVSDGNPIMVRVHVTDYFDNLFGNYGSDDASLHKAIKIIEKENRGVIILIRDTGKSIINNLITNQSNSDNRIQNTSDELRIYGMGAQILSEIGVKKMILLTNTEWKFIGLDAFDIEIIETKFLNTIND